MMPTESLPRGIRRIDSSHLCGGTRKSVRFSFDDRWDPMVQAEDIQLQCRQKTRDVQLQPPRRSSDTSPTLSRNFNREEPKPKRARSLLSLAAVKSRIHTSFQKNLTSHEKPPRKSSLPRTGLGNEKPPLMNMSPRSSYLIECALDVVRESSEHSQINKELVNRPRRTNLKSQRIPHCRQEALRNRSIRYGEDHILFTPCRPLD
jgi:hypothetical protein